MAVGRAVTWHGLTSIIIIRGSFAASLAMMKALCPTNIILDIIEKGVEGFQVNFSAWQ